MSLRFATAKNGAVLVTVNTNYKAAELEYIMKNADIHTMCMVNGYRDSDYVQILYDLVPELKTLPRGHLHSERFPELRNVVYIRTGKAAGHVQHLRADDARIADGRRDAQLKRKRRSAATTKSTCSTLPARPASRKGSC